MKIHNKLAIYIAIAVLLLDQFTKFLAARLNLGESVPLIQNILHLTLVHNRGAGFGILQGQRIFFIAFSLVVLGALIIRWKKIPEDIKAAIPLGLIIGGILGNLIDRIYLGYVIDFIDLRVWPVFNIADSAISIAAIWLIFYLWKK